jgi:putative transcriptional regulator
MESMDTSIDVAVKLEEIFEEELILPVDLFKSGNLEDKPEQITDNILQLLSQMGFEVFPTAQAPFNAVTRDEDLVVLTGISKFSQNMLKKAQLMSSLSAVARTQSAVIVEGESRVECIGDTAIIEKRELDTIGGTSEFEDLVLEKQNK